MRKIVFEKSAFEDFTAWMSTDRAIRRADPHGWVTNLVQDPVTSRRFYIAPESGGLYRADFTGGPP